MCDLTRYCCGFAIVTGLRVDQYDDEEWRKGDEVDRRRISSERKTAEQERDKRSTD